MAKEPLINNLELKIRQTSDVIAQAEYRAEMACYWARSGEFVKAEDICRELRIGYGSGHYPRISLQIMCLEGLLLFFRDVSKASLDRLSRALLLSRSLGMKDIAALSSSWMAHVHFNFDHYPEMCESLRSCFESLEAENIAARGRVAIVLSDAFFLSGDSSEAKRWFAIARMAATDSGDHTLVASLTYNRAALNAYLTQLKILQGSAPAESLAIVASEIGSAINYQRLVELRSLEQLLHLMNIGLCIFRQEFEAAWTIATRVRQDYDDVLLPRQRALLRAQMSLCAIMTKRETPEISVIGAGQRLDGFEACDSGDRALIADCCAKVAAVLGDPDVECLYKAEVSENLHIFGENMGQLQLHLSEFKEIRI